jgi:antitoxin component YwqK of YwqJK toxin-antitoxin module
MKKSFLFIFTIILLLTSCKKEDTTSNEELGSENGIYVKTVSHDQEVILKFTYDTHNNLIKKIINYHNSELVITYDYSDGKIVRETAKSGNSIVHQYNYTYDNNGNLYRCILAGTQPEVYWEFSYSNGKIIEAKQFINGEVGSKQIFTYENGNLTKAEEYVRGGNIWELETRIIMEYDNKNNPFRLHHIPFSEVMDEFAAFVSNNNQTSSIEYNGDGTIEYKVESEYNYNADSYPIILDQRDNDGPPVRYTILYE